MALQADSAALTELLGNVFQSLHSARDVYRPEPVLREMGTVIYVGSGIVRASGLRDVKSEELIRFPGNRLGMTLNVDKNETGIILLDENTGIAAGTEVLRTDRVLDVPVGESLLGRVVDALGRPMDGLGKISSAERFPMERPAPAIMDRLPVTVPLQTGLKAVDALIPIGRGQRELIIGDRQTGKTAIAVDTIINQRKQEIICIYCAIGKRASAVAKVIADLKEHDAMAYSIVLVATEDEPPGLQFVTPYAAMAVGEFFMESGRDVLVVFDDLTRHARAYRELSLLLRRPPGREAFPGDIFYIHSRLLERSTHLREDLGGGSLTALPIIETESQNISAYIPTNLISITDGQIYLSPDLFQKGILPAINVGKSVSRVGGKTQLAAYRAVSGDLRLSYSQFEELEAFSRFGTQLDEETQQQLARGRRIREILKQPQYRPLPVTEQIAVLLAAGRGVLDAVDLDQVGVVEKKIRSAVVEALPDVCARIRDGEVLETEDMEKIEKTARKAVQAETGNNHGNH